MPTIAELKEWAPVVASVASAVAALAALANLMFQSSNARRTRALNLLFKKEAEFDTERMRATRAKAAADLLAGGVTAEKSLDVEDVLNFMESVASLVQEGDIRLDQAWNTFYGWFGPWYDATKALVDAERGKDSSVSKDIGPLHEAMQRLQARRGKPMPRSLPTETITFLNDEARR